MSKRIVGFKDRKAEMKELKETLDKKVYCFDLKDIEKRLRR